METKMTGRVIVVGDNVDTDQIYPGAYLALTDPKEIGTHCLEGVSSDIASNFPQGGIVVAGRTFARIFYRNAVNLGLVPIVCPGISGKVKDGMTVTIDLNEGTAAILDTGETLPCDQLGEQQRMILEAGGIKPLMRKRFGKEA